MVGAFVGLCVGCIVGAAVGCIVGAADGPTVAKHCVFDVGSVT